MVNYKVFLCALFITANVSSKSLEVLHWWTAQGEVESQKILEKSLLEKGITWRNFAIIGEGGDSALRVLQMRALSGNPPDAAQIKGPDIGEWANVGMLEQVDQLIDTEQWPEIIPQVIRDTVSFDDHYMAVPVNVHRVNWLWLNKKIFDELKLPIPTTWDEFFIVADKIQDAGYLPLALGGTAWQDALVFESIAISILGANKYLKAFVEHDKSVLISDEMIDVFKTFKRLSIYRTPEMIGKDWFFASQLIATNKAAMQFMGDWAKGMWSAEGKIAMLDYMCVEVPESKGTYSYNIDSFVLFDKYNYLPQNNVLIYDHIPQNNVQIILADLLLSKNFQQEFSLSKGSIPIRNDIDMNVFDKCSQKSYHDFNHDQLVPSFSQNLATTSQLQNIMTQIISNYFNDPNAQAEEAVKLLSLAIHAVN